MTGPLPPALRNLLADGETVLAEWRPSLRSFMLRNLVIGAALGLVFAVIVVPWGSRAVLLSLIGGVVVWGVVLGDWTMWFQRRKDHWALTETRLLFANDRGYDPPAAIPLAEIVEMPRMARLSTTLRLSDGTKLRMPYLANPGAVVARIAAQRDAARPAQNLAP